jgi:predicted transcriptional regulator
MNTMKHETVQYFTDKEEQLTNLLIEIGLRKNVATVLVYLMNVPEATSRMIERGVDLRQPEVSMAIKYMRGQGWIKSQAIPSEKKGRPNKQYSLGMPVKVIMAALENAKKNEVKDQLARIRKMRAYL